jgi:hypothetical protein
MRVEHVDGVQQVAPYGSRKGQWASRSDSRREQAEPKIVGLKRRRTRAVVAILNTNGGTIPDNCEG